MFKTSNDFQIIVYFLLVISLHVSCVNNKPSEANSNQLETIKPIPVSLNNNDSLLKYTSGIRAVLQDSKGNYWFGSHQEGACLFDGKSFEYFTVEDGLNDNQVRSIQEDNNGVIWFGTAKGVNSYEQGKIKRHTPQNSLNSFQPPFEKKWEVTQNDLWFNAGNAPGVYRYDGQHVHYLALPVQASVQGSFSAFGNTGFSKGKKGNLWIATYNAVFGYDGQQFEIIDDTLLNLTNKPGRMHVRSILEDRKGNVWIGNNGIGVLLKKGDSILNFSKEYALIHPNSTGRGDPSPAGTLEHVFEIKEDHKGNIWFGDRDTGAWKYDGTSIKNYSVDSTLKTQMVWNIYEDNHNNLLFAMGDGGVYSFDGHSFKRKF